MRIAIQGYYIEKELIVSSLGLYWLGIKPYQF